MADLPGVPRRNPTTRAAQSGLSASDIAAPFQTIAEAGQAFGMVATEWNKRVEDGLRSEKRNQIDLGVGELQRQYAGRPQDLQAALPGFRQRVTEGLSPRMADEVGMYADTVGTRALDSERDREFRVSTERAEGADKARVETLATKAAVLARAGQTDSEDYKGAVAEIGAIRARRTENPLSPYSAAEAKLDGEALADGLSLESVYGMIERNFERMDGDPAARAVALKKFADDAIKSAGFTDPNVAQKKTDAFIKSLAAEGWEGQRAVKDEIDAAIEDVRSDPALADDPGLETLYERARQFGLDREAGQLRKARSTARLNGNVLIDPAQRRNILRGGDVRISAGADAAGLIRQFEGFRESPYWDVNAFRTGYGSDTITRADGSIVRVGEGMRVSREDAERDLSRRIGEFQSGIVRDVGADTWGRLPANVQAALTSVAYNYGSLPNRVAQAVSVGDVDGIAEAVESLSGHNGGVNSGRRAAEAAVIRGGGTGPRFSEDATELRKAAERQQKIVDSDPLQVWNMTRDPARADQRLGDIDFANPQSVQTEIGKRVQAARYVANLEGIADVPAFQESDAKAFANTISRGAPEAADRAFSALAGLPDDVLVPTLGMKDVKEAVLASTRSPDLVKFTQAMTYIDQMWARAPQDVAHALGQTAIKNVQDWQAAYRYYSEEELADRLKRRDDPQVAARLRTLSDEGEKLARKKTAAEVVEDFGSWNPFVSDPSSPDAPEARETLMGDYIALFGERYSVAQDETVAHEQAVERLKTIWGRSSVNNGRLTMYAPETLYRPVNGSHDWMREQLVGDLTDSLGAAPEDFEIVPDRQTKVDADAGRPPSYLVVVTKPDGRQDFVRTANGQRMRYAWNAEAMMDDAAARFQQQREKVFSQRPTQALMRPPWVGQGLPRDNTFPQSVADLRTRLRGE